MLKSFVWFLTTPAAHAHVKWFARNMEQRTPADLGAIGTISFWWLLALSVVTIGALVYLDRPLHRWGPFARLDKRLAAFEDRSTLILRVFTGASILLAWQVDTVIAPELKVPAGAQWFEFAVALLLLLPKTTPLAGAGLMCIYLYAAERFGVFHLLDYLVYPAIGYFLLAESFRTPRLRNTRLPVLYVGLGFSLCWAALEKLFFPHWGLNVLEQHPALTMGLPPEFFLLACAFVELSLGYLLIIGLLQRSLALVITLTFFTTTAFFGKVEVIGHTILHGALLVFIVSGPGGYYPPPIEFHRRLWLRAAFAAVNFVVVGAGLGLAYWFLAHAGS